MKDKPAFPTGETKTYTNLGKQSPSDPDERTVPINSGMTLHQWYAGMAIKTAADMLFEIDTDEAKNAKKVAKFAITIADAMINEGDRK